MKARYRPIAAVSTLALMVAMTATVRAQATSDRSTASGAAAHSSTAQDRVTDAVKVVDHMKHDTHLVQLLDRAHGVFIVPHYGKAAFVVGGQGGGGVLLARHTKGWSDPAFYNIGGGSIGLQAGGEGGAIAMLLMTRKALDKFESTNSTWSLGTSAGLTVVTYSGKARAQSGNGDVVLWSDTSGLFGGVNVNVVDITPDTKLNQEYYGRQIDQRTILNGSIESPSADTLRHALPMQLAAAH